MFILSKTYYLLKFIFFFNLVSSILIRVFDKVVLNNFKQLNITTFDLLSNVLLAFNISNKLFK